MTRRVPQLARYRKASKYRSINTRGPLEVPPVVGVDEARRRGAGPGGQRPQLAHLAGVQGLVDGEELVVLVLAQPRPPLQLPVNRHRAGGCGRRLADRPGRACPGPSPLAPGAILERPCWLAGL